ncbi:MAG: 2Fe-2S iron-sulfur cluster-binding protein [Pseudomonadota bacterium]
MIAVTFIEHDGSEHRAQGDAKQSLMEVARDNNVPGILADCGGACACATCHVMVADDWWSRLPDAAAEEDSMLDLGLEQRTERSRLACQITLSEELNGIVVNMPESQI